MLVTPRLFSALWTPELIDRILKPFKTDVLLGRQTVDDSFFAVNLLFRRLAHLDDTPEFKKFRKNANRIYETEVYAETKIKYGTSDRHLSYTIEPPSESDVHGLYQWYKHFSGEGYESPDDLYRIVQKLVERKRILELGCGPGFQLKVLRDLGAHVTGVELSYLEACVPDLDIRRGRAQDMDELLRGEEFDCMVSRNFLCETVIPEEDTRTLLQKMYEQTKKGGIHLHQMAYDRIPPPVYLFFTWVQCFIAEVPYEPLEKKFWALPPDEQAVHLRANRPYLTPRMTQEVGFTVRAFEEENDELNIILVKE